jgi:hypothetical protein
MIKPIMQVHSLTEIHQRSTPLNGYLDVMVIWNNICSLRLADGTACSAGSYISGFSKLRRRCPLFLRGVILVPVILHVPRACRGRKNDWPTPYFSSQLRI